MSSARPCTARYVCRYFAPWNGIEVQPAPPHAKRPSPSIRGGLSLHECSKVAVFARLQEDPVNGAGHVLSVPYWAEHMVGGFMRGVSAAELTSVFLSPGRGGEVPPRTRFADASVEYLSRARTLFMELCALR
jgi:hypothetical protein